MQLANTQRHGVAFQVVAVAGAGDRIQTQFVGLPVGVFAIGNDADGLALEVAQLGLTTLEIKGDVVDPANRSFSQQAVVLRDRADEGIFGPVEIDGNVGVGHGCWFRRGLGGQGHWP